MINIYLTNLGKYNEGYLIGEWIELPIDEEELQDCLDRIGINEEYEEYFITDYETDLPISIGEYENISSLNEMAETLLDLSEYEANKYKAILEAGFWSNHNDIMDNLNNYNLLEEVKDSRDYGEMLINESTNIPEYIIGYIDLESYGEDMASGIDGAFTEYGWIERI